MMAAALGLGLVALLAMRKRGAVTPARANAAAQNAVDAVTQKSPDPDAPPRVSVPLDEAGRVTVDERGLVHIDGAEADAAFHISAGDASLIALAQGGPDAAAAVEAGQAAINQAQSTYEREVAQGVHGEGARQAQIASDRRENEAKEASRAFARRVNRKVSAILKADGFSTSDVQDFLGFQYSWVRSEMEERTGSPSTPAPRDLLVRILRDAYQWKYERRTYSWVNDDDGNRSHLQSNTFGLPSYTPSEQADVERREKKAQSEMRKMLAAG